MTKKINACLEANFQHNYNRYRIWYSSGKEYFEAVRICIDGIPQTITKELENFCKVKIENSEV
jgi:hypothetical protein